MKQAIVINSILLFFTFFFSQCATIVGGSKYNAHVVVNNNSRAAIAYQGKIKGYGTAFFKVNRRHANKFLFTVKEEGCQEQKFSYVSRKLRGWALAGTILGWTGLTLNGEFYPIPFGLVVDVATGALWKPNTAEKGISKVNHKNYLYEVSYTSCRTNNSLENEQNKSTVVDVVYLKNGTIIKGVIIELSATEQVKIKSINGGVFEYKMTEIEKITKENE